MISNFEFLVLKFEISNKVKQYFKNLNSNDVSKSAAFLKKNINKYQLNIAVEKFF